MLKGKTAVVTGGSRGIGEAIVYKFASMGADVAVIYAGNTEKAEAVCQKCVSDYGIAPISRFDTEKYKVRLAAQVKGFDPKEYLDVNETLRTDRYAQFAVAAAEQAVSESGIRGTVEPERFAVIFGTGIGGIGTFEAEHTKLMEKGPRRVSPLFVPMMIGNMAAGLIAIKNDCRGSAMPAVTACASGSNAIGEAMRLIRHGYADAVISGGAEASVVPSAVAGFTNMQALSTAENPDEASLPFDKRRGGFVIGEGAAGITLVLLSERCIEYERSGHKKVCRAYEGAWAYRS